MRRLREKKRIISNNAWKSFRQKVRSRRKKEGKKTNATWGFKE